MRRIAVIGGGLAGLTVAFRRSAAGDAVVLCEPAARLGGQLWTVRAGGFVVEHGAEGFVARSEAVPALAADLGIEADLIGQSETRSYGFGEGGLVSLGPGEAAAFLGFQVPRDEMGKGIRSFLLGMGELSDALASAVQAHADVRLRTRVAAIAPAGERWRLELEGETAEEVDPVDEVVVATGAAAAAEILGQAFGDVARALRAASAQSSVTVTLAYVREAIEHPLDATGFVVAAARQEHGFRAATFITSKFPARAPAGHVSIRLFFRPSAEDLASMTDEAWTARAEACLGRILPVRGRPLEAWVSRWESALPVFEPRHVERVRALEARLAGRGVLLAGSAFHGSGIDAAVRSAETAAKRVSVPPR